MKSVSVIAALAMVLVLASAERSRAADAKGLLDGKTFLGQVCAKGQTEGDSDVLTFKGGRFHSLACEKYGFGDGAYTATNSGGFILFTAETHSDNGTIMWQGRATKNSIDGSMVFRRKKTWYNFFLPSTEEKIFTARSK